MSNPYIALLKEIKGIDNSLLLKYIGARKECIITNVVLTYL
jgi:hypothetical protein